MSVLLQAAQCDKYNSVTTGLVTERCSCSVPKNPPSHCLLHIHSPLSSPPTQRLRILLYTSAADVVSKFSECYFMTSHYTETWCDKISSCRSNLQHCCCRSITGILFSSSALLFDTDLVYLNCTRLAIQAFTSDECWNNSVFYCLLRTAQYRQIARVRRVQFRVLQ